MAKNKNNTSNNNKNTSGVSRNTSSSIGRNDTGGTMKDTHAQVPGSGQSRSGPGGE
jgi:hypothetical protein